MKGKKQNPQKRKPTFLSLFSGVGGFDLGFIEAGYNSVGAFDYWEPAVENYRSNLASSANLVDLASSSIELKESPDVVIAGSPCQGFSTLGKRDIHDPRNTLYEKAAEIAVAINPQAIVLENVFGILSGHQSIHFDAAVALLLEAKYSINLIRLDAKDLGLPQSRKRVFVIATKNEQNIGHNLTKKYSTLGQVLLGAENFPNHEPVVLEEGTAEIEIANSINPGQKLCDVRGGNASVHSWEIPEVFGTTTTKQKEILAATMKLRRRIRLRDHGDADPILYSDLRKELKSVSRTDISKLISKNFLIKKGHRYDLTRRFNGKYRRLKSDGISNTVDTKFGDPRYFLHPFSNRGLSVREAARIQGFPDWFTLRGAISDQFRMIGNAVPIPMAVHVARIVSRSIQV